MLVPWSNANHASNGDHIGSQSLSFYAITISFCPCAKPSLPDNNGEPTAAGGRSGGAVSRKRLRWRPLGRNRFSIRLSGRCNAPSDRPGEDGQPNPALR